VADFYTSLSVTAVSLIADKGKDITISRDTGQLFDPVTGKYGAGTTETQTVKAAVLPASSNDIRYKRDELTFEKLNKLLMAGAALTFDPEPGQTVVIGTDIWFTIEATPTNPNDGTPLIWEVFIKI
jgi:hypothetical protein